MLFQDPSNSLDLGKFKFPSFTRQLLISRLDRTTRISSVWALLEGHVGKQMDRAVFIGSMEFVQ